MNYHSHVLYYPNKTPFDRPDSRWAGFVGEFVKPVVASDPTLLFWCTDYGACARFRVYTDDYDSLRPILEQRRDALGLEDRGEEKGLSLVDDLGNGRFLAPGSNSTPEKRALLILQALSAAARLVVDSVVRHPDGYWGFEEGADPNQNPDHCHLFSVMHLLHNMTASDAVVYLYEDGGVHNLLSYIYFWNAASAGQIRTASHRAFRVRM